MNDKNKYLNLIIFFKEYISIASTLMKLNTLEIYDNHIIFHCDEWMFFNPINNPNLESIDLDRSGGIFYLDYHDVSGYIIFGSRTIEEAKERALKLLKYYEKVVR